ncbi:DEAD/DEAH box helicase [uncultured Thiothrix sp.]|uniref:DEAD/DEAH box helicase n=1 Tax=uncultured Thiothrix sp. TaxID=223185 RepID=UPI00262ECA0D|nr:nuclease-related domain-containing DEAD/DEAH box helicase [uncultured Thiothrix sp.]
MTAIITKTTVTDVAKETNKDFLSTFIETENIAKEGLAGEQRVWQACKNAFSGRQCLAFWRYPIFSNLGEKRKEPDILLIDRELGVIVIEVKSISIDQIQAIDGHSWTYNNFYKKSGSPYAQAEDYLFAVLGRSDREQKLRRQIRGRALVALPNISESEWKAKNFDQSLACPPILFANQLGAVTLLRNFENTPPVQAASNLSDYQWALLLSVIGGSQVMRKPKIEPQPEAGELELERLNIINHIRKSMYSLDLQQLSIAMEIPPGVQRIRGIAGSGKTLLLCQKAAHMHLKHPDWDIALVFFTRSLYEHMQSSLDKWLRHFTNGDTGYNDKARSKLKVFHAWGAKNRDGIYRYICEKNNIRPLTVNETNYKKPSEGLADICGQLLKSGKILTPLFDAVLIDEGQDLVVDNQQLMYEGKQPIYWLIYQSLKNSDPDDTKMRRLIWAYDEAQSLDTLKIPEAKEFFGDSTLLQRSYKGGILKSHIMKRCFRTPKPILMLAQGLGMGLMRKEGMLCGITDQEDWDAIGYKVIAGDFKTKDQDIVLTRPNENSPNPTHRLYSQKCIQFKHYPSRQEELLHLAENIQHNLKVENIPSELGILVVVLGNGYEAIKLEEYIASFLISSGIDIFVASGTRLNQPNPKYPDNDPDAFWYAGGVTISRVVRAKGNEADIVYVVGMDLVAEQEHDLLMRNQLLVAVTRSRGWVVMSGVEHENCYPFYDEVNEALTSANKGGFCFKYKKDKTIAYNEVDTSADHN